MSILFKAILVFMMVVVITVVFWFKSKVQTSEVELHKLDLEIKRAVDSLAVLNAEWSYLNQPERLKERNQNELGLRRKTAAEIYPLEAIPMLLQSRADSRKSNPSPPPAQDDGFRNGVAR